MSIRTCAQFLVAICIVAVLSSTRAEEPKKEEKKQPKIAVQFTLEGCVAEQSPEEAPFQLFGDDVKTVGIRDWVKRFEKAATGERVGGVLLVIDEPSFDWSHALALRDAIEKIKKAGKPVVVYADNLTATQFIVAGAASKIFISPGGILLLNGINARQYFLKGSLDKLGIQADMLHIGSHKTAAEALTLTRPSKQSEEMMNWLLDDLYDQLCEQVGHARGRDKATGKSWLEGGPYTAQQALDAKLIDGLKSRLEAAAELKTLVGLNADDKLDRTFGENKAKGVDLSSPFAVFKIFSDLAASSKPESDKPAVGIIYAEGEIASGKNPSGIGSLTTIAAIEKARKDANIKSVVLRINSPGGSALASEEIHAALLKLKAEKPLIVSCGALAASGGYYIAAPGEKIFAEASTLIGSIGVVGGKLVMKGFYDWIGVSSFKFSRGGAKAGIFDETTPFTQPEKEWFVISMNQVYDQFVKAVKDGRGDKLKDFEEKITGGKVFTGSQGIKNGLADELGDLSQAISFAATRAGLNAGNPEVRVINKPENPLQKFFKGLSGKEDEDDASVSAASRLKLPDSKLAEVRDWLSGLRRINPTAAGLIERQLRSIELLSHEKVLMLSPFEIDVRP
jgi:protease-4